MVFYAKETGLLQKLEVEQVKDFLEGFETYAREADPGLFTQIRALKDLNDEIKRRITKVVDDFIKQVQSRVVVPTEDTGIEQG